MSRPPVEFIKKRSEGIRKRTSENYRNAARANHTYIIELCEYIEQLESVLEEARKELESRCF